MSSTPLPTPVLQDASIAAPVRTYCQIHTEMLQIRSAWNHARELGDAPQLIDALAAAYGQARTRLRAISDTYEDSST